MRILIVGPHGVLGRALLGILASEHDVRSLDPRLLGDDPQDRDVAAAATPTWIASMPGRAGLTT